MNSENLNTKTFGNGGQPELNFQADSLNPKSRPSDLLPYHKSTLLSLGNQTSSFPKKSQANARLQNQDIPQDKNINQFVLFPSLQPAGQCSGSVQPSRQQMLCKKILAKQRELMQNLKKIQKQFKNGGVQNKEELLQYIIFTKRRVVSLLNKHRND